MIMKKLMYAVALVLAVGSSMSVFAQEPEKKDTTVVEKPESSLAVMQEPEKKDSTSVETPKDGTSVSLAMMEEPEKKDSTTVENPKEEVPTSYAMAQEPEKKEQSEPADSTKQEKSTCEDAKLA